MMATTATMAPAHFIEVPTPYSKARPQGRVEGDSAFGEAHHARNRYPVLNIQRTTAIHPAKKSRIMPALKVTLTSASP